MKTIFLPGLFALLLTIISCDKPVDSFQYVSRLELYHCADTAIDGNTIRICFDSLRDSRCPLNAVCVWQGEASAKLSLQANGNKDSFTLSTLNMPPNYRNDTLVSGYRIKLLSVTPYPGSQLDSPQQVELSITK